MSRLTRMMDKIRKRGIIGTLRRLAGGGGYALLRPFAISQLRKTEIDEKKITFYSQPSFSDNAKSLFDWLMESREIDASWKIVWLIQREDEIPSRAYENVRFVRATSYDHQGYTFGAIREAYTSRYVFYTHSSPLSGMGNREGQTVVNLWHGCGYKDASGDRKFYDQNYFDMALVPGPLFVEKKAAFWGCEAEKVLPNGYPRYDEMTDRKGNGHRFVSSFLTEDRKMILWMPTFRNSVRSEYPEGSIPYSFDFPLLESKADLCALDELCGRLNMLLMIKRHPMQKKYSFEDERFENVILVDNEALRESGVSLYEILRYSSALISDYSSISVDYLLLDRPIAYTLDDYEAYGNARGFVFEDPLQYMPGNHLYQYGDLKEFLEEVARGEDKHDTERERCRRLMHNPCANYSERIWKKVRESDE